MGCLDKSLRIHCPKAEPLFYVILAFQNEGQGCAFGRCSSLWHISLMHSKLMVTVLLPLNMFIACFCLLLFLSPCWCRFKCPPGALGWSRFRCSMRCVGKGEVVCCRTYQEPLLRHNWVIEHLPFKIDLNGFKYPYVLVMTLHLFLQTNSKIFMFLPLCSSLSTFPSMADKNR